MKIGVIQDSVYNHWWDQERSLLFVVVVVEAYPILPCLSVVRTVVLCPFSGLVVWNSLSL